MCHGKSKGMKYHYQKPVQYQYRINSNSPVKEPILISLYGSTITPTNERSHVIYHQLIDQPTNHENQTKKANNQIINHAIN